MMYIEEMLDKLEEIKELVIATICDSQSICNHSCNDCELNKDIKYSMNLRILNNLWKSQICENN